VAVALLRTLHQLFGKRLVADVARDGEGAASLVGNFTDEGLQFRLATSGDDDLGACRANSFAAARPIPELAPVTIAALPLRSIMTGLQHNSPTNGAKDSDRDHTTLLTPGFAAHSTSAS
jgi:hypothetical protein